MYIFPNPKKMICKDLFINKRIGIRIALNEFNSPELDYSLKRFNISDVGVPISLKINNSFKKEQYTLVLDNKYINIAASTPRGAFNALISLRVMLNQSSTFCAEIEDWPDFPERGLMIDYSRGRIPTLETMKKVVDRISEMKYNQIQMAFDSIVFEYKGLEKYYEGKPIVTVNYVRELQEYCKKNFIELVPNQNSFGHLTEWLAFDDFKDLAECPGGFYRTDEFGRRTLWQARTVDPNDPRSLKLIDRIYNGILPYFDSKLMHVCCDETFEFNEATGKSGDLIRKYGANKVYTDYMNKLVKLCNKYGKKMMFWADMIVDNVEALKNMPRDSIAVVWGYEMDFPFERQCRNVHDSGLDLYVAPGTCSWGSIVGRSTNMKYNLLSAAESGKKYNARGYLLTDWGDTGHVQNAVVSYVPIAYGAGLSWGVEQNREIENACKYLDEQFFCEKGFSKFLFECGNAHNLEAYQRFNQTVTITALSMDLDDNIYMAGQKPEHFHNIIRHADEYLNKLNRFECCASEHIEEIGTNLKILKTAAKVCLLKLGENIDTEEIISEFESENALFEKQWLSKNTPYCSDNYINITKKLISQLRDKDLIIKIRGEKHEIQAN